jgi:hypothetical protein
MPSRAAGAEHAILVDPDDRADRGALDSFEAGESPLAVDILPFVDETNCDISPP